MARLARVHVCRLNGVEFDADSNSSIGKMAPVGGRPYAEQKAVFRLRTVMLVNIGDIIDDIWRISSFEVFTSRCIVACTCYRHEPINAACVDIVELTRREGPFAKTEAKTRVSNLRAGRLEASTTSTTENDRRIQDGQIMFYFADRLQGAIADRHMIKDGDQHFCVDRILDVDHPYRPMTFVTSPSSSKR